MSHSNNPSNFIAMLYSVGHLLHRAELNPKYYGSDIQLYPNEAYTLRIISENQGISQKEVTQMMHRTKGATSVVIKALIQKGLVVTRNESPDMRISSLYPTQKGSQVALTHLDYDRRYIEKFLASEDIPPEDLLRVQQTLQTFITYIDQRSLQQNDDFT